MKVRLFHSDCQQVIPDEYVCSLFKKEASLHVVCPTLSAPKGKAMNVVERMQRPNSSFLEMESMTHWFSSRRYSQTWHVKHQHLVFFSSRPLKV